MAASIAGLMISPFFNRTLDKQIEIISEGKPRPVIEKCINFLQNNISVNKLYDEEVWLTASRKLDSIICWTCLLFPLVKTDIKPFVGKITDNKNLYRDIQQHKTSFNHIYGLYQYRVFLKEKMPKVDILAEKKLKENIQRNDEILKRIIKALCFLVSNASPPVKITGAFNLFHAENCIQLLMSLKNQDTSNLTNEAINIAGRYPEIIMKTVRAIANIMKKQLEVEIKSCRYVSLILSEHSTNSKLSLVFRYVYKGKCCERFIAFIDTVDTSIDMIKEYILRVISHYEISSKLFSLSCGGGGVLTKENVSYLLASLKDRGPYCLFVPCHFHDINVVLEQRLCNLEGCEVFFTIVNSMNRFLQNNSRLCDILITFSKIPDLCKLKLSNGQFLRILKLYRRPFKTFFSHIDENCEKLSNDELANVMGFQCLFQQYQFVFMIEAFYKLFSHVAVLSDMLNSSSPEKAFDYDILNSVDVALIQERRNGFENLWTIVITDFIKDCNPESLQSVGKCETDALLELYSKAVDCLIEEINIRFKCVRQLKFLSILNCEAHDKLLVSNYQVRQIHQIPKSFLNKRQLLTEMKVLRKQGSLFGGKSVHGFMDFFTKMGLKNTFKHIYRLGEIILTLPCKPNSCSKSHSKLDIIESWVLVSNVPELKLLSHLFIEENYLEQLTCQAEFYDNVILKLRKMNSDLPAMLGEIKSELVKSENGIYSEHFQEV